MENKEIIDYEILPEEIKFSFMCLMQAAIRLRLEEYGEAEFLIFAKGIWETVEMNDLNELDNLMQDLCRYEMKNRVNDLPQDFYEEMGLKKT